MMNYAFDLEEKSMLTEQELLYMLEENEEQIRLLEKASGYKIDKLIELFINNEIVFTTD